MTLTRNSPPKKKKKSYHHGDLRQSLIYAAVEIIAEREQAEFTLRELARRLNVTHAATYHHFKDKEDLLAAVAEDGFVALLSHLQAAVNKCEGESQLMIMRILGAAYIEFAVENAAHFRVMYQRDYSHDPDRFAATLEASNKQRQFVLEQLEKTAQTGVYREMPEEEFSAATWSLLHGLAMLIINGLLIVPEGQTVFEYSTRITRHLYVGLASDASRARLDATSIVRVAEG